MECLSCNIKELKNTKDERNHVNSIVARDFSGSSLDVSAIQQMLLAVSFQLAACTRIFGRKCECSSSVIFFGTNFETLQKLSFQVILAIITHCASRLDLTELIVFGCIGSNVWRKGPEKITTPAFFFPRCSLQMWALRSRPPWQAGNPLTVFQTTPSATGQRVAL